MGLGYAPVQQSAVAVGSPVESQPSSRTHQIVLSLVRAVSNLNDEHDVQCLTFLAGELGLLRNSPFCFSRALASESAIPESLILRDTFNTMLRDRVLVWDKGSLRALVDPDSSRHEHHVIHNGVSWLGALSPSERLMLTRATVLLHATGCNLLRSSADAPFRRVMSRMIGSGEGAEAVERRLNMVRNQLLMA